MSIFSTNIIKMASPCEHGSARIQVQVVATLLPLDLPVHVNSFWTLIKFSETQRIRNVEDKILLYLNAMAKESPLEIVVHDRPITPNWKYVPVTLSSEKDTHLPQQNVLSNSSSVDSAAVQELSILLKPHVCEYGNKKMTKPPRPILMSFDISDSLPKSVRLIFKKQLVFMQDSVLLSNSRSDILRDNDVVVINAICAFFTVETVGKSKKLSHEADSLETEVELDSFSRDTLKDLDQNCLLFDTNEESSLDIGVELSPEIKTKLDTILQKLASLKYSHKGENRCVILHKTSKKRKICQEDNRTELSNSINAVTSKNDHQDVKQKKKSAGEHLTQDHNEISATNEIDLLVRKSRKKRKRKRRSENEVDTLDSIDTSFTHATDEIVQKSQTGAHHNGREEEKSRCCPAAEVSGQSLNTSSTNEERKSAGFRLSSVICALKNQQDMEVNEGNYKIELIDKESEKQVKDSAIENATKNVSVSGKKGKRKRRSEIDVDTLDSIDTSFTHATDEIVQKSQTGPNNNGREEEKARSCPAAEVSVQLLNTSSTNIKRKPAGFGLSSLIFALRSQQAVETNEDNHKMECINKETEKDKVKDSLKDIVTENETKQNVSFQVMQLDSSQVTPKRKRVRKRKKKNSSITTITSNSDILECRERDYTLKLAEHHMPQNNRVTFECDSDDDAAQTNQTACVAHSSPLLDRHEHFHTQNSVTENSYSQGEVNHTINISATSESAETIFNKAGAAINPDEKFQALLNQCGRIGRQFETISSNGEHTVIRGLRQKRNKCKSNMADAVDPERDVLTNVSIITTQVLETETSASKTSGYIEPNHSASVDSPCKHPSQPGHKKLASSHLNITQEKKCSPAVEANPHSMNYVLCQKLQGLPIEGDIIAYKILELSEDYTPGLSSFKEAKVINVNTQTGSILMEPRGRKDNKIRTGRFELTIDVTDNGNTEEDDSLVAVELTDLIDTRLVYRPN